MENNILDNIIKNLKKLDYKLAIAESTTGGLISSTIVSSELGVSNVYNGAIIAYNNEAKMKLLSVKGETLARYGAISKYAAVEMAIGVKKALSADVTVAITGNVGPKSSEDKEIGLIYFVILINDIFYEFEMNIPNLGRNKNRILATQKVFEELDKLLEKTINDNK